MHGSPDRCAWLRSRAHYGPSLHFCALGRFVVLGRGADHLWFVSDSFWKEWEVVELVGISVLAALVMGIKFLVRRRRPEGEWGGIYRNTDPHSFPSGHAARAFLIAVIGSALGPAWLGIILMGLGAARCACARGDGRALRVGCRRRSDAGHCRVCPDRLADLRTVFSWLTGLIGFPLW
jgi:membrane-associated phospholipid phosphatase